MPVTKQTKPPKLKSSALRLWESRRSTSQEALAKVKIETELQALEGGAAEGWQCGWSYQPTRAGPRRPLGQPNSFPGFGRGKSLCNLELAQAKKTLCTPLTINLVHLKLGLAHSASPPSATVLLNLVLFAATQRTLLFVSISGSAGDRQTGTGVVKKGSALE